jgi:hypothetical protein
MREADHSPQTSAEVQYTWIYTSTTPIIFHGVVLNWLITGTILLYLHSFNILRLFGGLSDMFTDIDMSLCSPCLSIWFLCFPKGMDG